MEMPNQTKFKIKIGGKIYTKRLFATHDQVCEYLPHSRKLGHPIPYHELADWESIMPRKVNEVAMVRRFITNVVKYLDESKWWKEICADYKLLLKQDDKFIEDLIKMPYKDKNILFREKFGHDIYLDDILTSAYVGIKSINYGNDERKFIIPKIDKYVQHLNDNALFPIEPIYPFTYRWRKKYDNTLSICFNQDKNDIRGYYSEEYKDCGNGHYYMALDKHHAIFVEND